MMSKGYVKHLIERFMLEDDKVAFCFYDGKIVNIITYREFVNDILKVAGYFKKNEISKKHIALIAPNSYRWLVTFFAIIVTGNIAVLLDYLLPEEILRKQCELADVSIIYNNQKARNSLLMEMDVISDEILMCEIPMSQDDVYEGLDDDTIILLGTSGTTGSSKIVEITSKNIKYNIFGFEKRYAKDRKERILAVFPFYHIGGLITVLTNLYWAKVTCMGRGAKYVFADIPVLNPTLVAMVPATLESLEKILKSLKFVDERKKYLGNSLRRINVAGAALKASTCKFFLDQGIVLEIGYGMTETSGGIMWCELSEKCIGTIGKSVEGVSCTIADGEILVKSPVIMKGYYKDPYATKQIIKDGWLYTGDMGYCDDDGYYYLTGRKKNVIILSNGENVNPEEIEGHFYKCNDIIEVLVYSDGKGICADLYTENKDRVIEYVKAYNENMPLYRQVYKVNYQDVPLEKTSSGKIKRKENIYAK